MKKLLTILLIALFLPLLASAFTARTIDKPATNAALSSSVMRNEFQLLEDRWAALFSNQAYGVSTSTVLGFTGGIFSNASSTFAIARIPRLANLTDNGFIKTSGSDGTLSIDTATYASFAWPFTNSASWVSTSTLLNLSGGVMSTASSSFQYFNSASSSIDVLRINTRAGVATSTPGQGAAFGVTGDAFFSGEVFASNVADTALTGTSCVGETNGLLNTNNCVISVGQTYGSAQNGVITLATSTTAITNDWGITNSGGTFTFNIPDSTASVRGLLTAANWTTFNAKESALTFNYPLSRSVNAISTAATSTLFANLVSGLLGQSDSGTTYKVATSTLYSNLVSGTLAQSSSGSTYLAATSTNASFTFATSSLGTATTTIPLAGFYGGTTVTQFGCAGRGGGTFRAQIGDGTSSTTLVTSATGLTTSYTSLSSNNVFTHGEVIFWAFGGVSGTVADVSCSWLRN